MKEHANKTEWKKMKIVIFGTFWVVTLFLFPTSRVQKKKTLDITHCMRT